MPINKTSRENVLVALSGGVDSSVCAELLARQGFSVSGAVLDLSPAHKQTVEAAKQAALALNIPLRTVHGEAAFESNVILPFCEEYRRGRTPNPCVICNPTVKFRLIAEAADEEGIFHVATGHYARVVHCGNGRFAAAQAQSVQRDQSYMLYRLPQSILSRLIMPLGQLEKPAVRQIAHDASLPCADAPDSQEICFIPDGDYVSYIIAHTGPCPAGDVIGPDGKVAGHHNGILGYTVGQRRGLGLSFDAPVFVSRIDGMQNRIYLSYSGGEYKKEIVLRDCVWQAIPSLESPQRISAKVRSRAPLAPGEVFPLLDEKARVLFDEPVRAPAPGQSCVLYDGDVVLGGGIITEE